MASIYTGVKTPTVFPYVGIMVLVLITVVLFPGIATWFPNTVIR